MTSKAFSNFMAIWILRRSETKALVENEISCIKNMISDRLDSIVKILCTDRMCLALDTVSLRDRHRSLYFQSIVHFALSKKLLKLV